MNGQLLANFKQLVDLLNRKEVPYAICGGIALAIHGAPRSTIDIDILVPHQRVPEAINAAKELGFTGEDVLAGLNQGLLVITRMVKMLPPGEDFLILDVIHADGELLDFFQQRQLVHLPEGTTWVLSRENLIRMKRRRNSMQDQADIERLAGDTNED